MRISRLRLLEHPTADVTAPQQISHLMRLSTPTSTNSGVLHISTHTQPKRASCRRNRRVASEPPLAVRRRRRQAHLAAVGAPDCRCHCTAPSSQERPHAALPFPGNRGTPFGRLLTKCWYYGAPVACTFLSADLSVNFVDCCAPDCARGLLRRGQPSAVQKRKESRKPPGSVHT